MSRLSFRSMAQHAPWLLAFGLVLSGIAWMQLSFTTTLELPVGEVVADSGHAYGIGVLAAPPASELPGDDSQHPARSTLRLLENGTPMGPAHSLHVDIRQLGAGRFSHWGNGLLFSASDNTDPRTNGRRYALAYDVSLPAWVGVLLFLSGLATLAYLDRKGWGAALRESGALLGRLAGRVRSSTFPAWALVHLAILAALFGWSLFQGFDRSGWILITQPLESSHSTNSLLGYSYVREGSVLHKENYSSFLQVAFFSGAQVTPDLYFRRPVYTFLAMLLAPAVGVAPALFLINALAWLLAVWLTYRFARNFHADPEAGRWASLLAAGGIGFVLHALDLSAHLLSFAFYMAGVALIHESQVWRRTVEVRVHLAICAFLMLACLQYNTGIALVAAYVAVAIRNNPIRHILPVTVLALAAQPIWGAVVGWIFGQRYGTVLPDLSLTEWQYLQRALRAWALIAQQPLGEMFATSWGLVSSFLFFEMPLVTAIGAFGLANDLRKGPEGRARAMFALPFIVFPVLAALVFAPSHLFLEPGQPPAAGARGYLIYGISILFFASCGATLAALTRQNRAIFLPLAVLLVILSFAWSTAHFFNAMGPGKAYFLGMDYASHLFGKGTWEAVSLTGHEVTPRLFGGSASMTAAGLSPVIPTTGSISGASAAHAVLASALFVALFTVLLVAGAGVKARLALAAALIVLTIPVLASRLVEHDAAVAAVDRVYRIERATSVDYEIDLAESVRERLIAGLRAGNVIAVFPAFHAGPHSPEVRINGHLVPFAAKLHHADWILDPRQSLAGLESRRAATIAVRFSGGVDVGFGGWQRIGLQGRRIAVTPAGAAPPILPALEIRLIRGKESFEPILIGF